MCIILESEETMSNMLGDERVHQHDTETWEQYTHNNMHRQTSARAHTHTHLHTKFVNKSKCLGTSQVPRRDKNIREKEKITRKGTQKERTKQRKGKYIKHWNMFKFKLLSTLKRLIYIGCYM